MPVTDISFKSVNLLPGEIYVALEPTLISTLLGSCVSVCLYSASPVMGAMSHSLLPLPDSWSRHPDMRYVECAINSMLDEMRRTGARISDIKAKLFGGAEMYARPGRTTGIVRMVGDANTAAARELLRQKGIDVVSECVGGRAGMKLIFNTLTGVVFVRKMGVGLKAAGNTA